MRISFERSGGSNPSGGRGEYEFRADEGRVHAAEIKERELILSLPHGWVLRTGLHVTLDSGKWRLRSIRKDERMMIQRQLAAALMLPKPRRSYESLGIEPLIIQRERYVMDDILLGDVDDSRGDAVVLKVEKIVARNRGSTVQEIDLQDRVDQIQNMWKHIDSFPDDIRQLIHDHKGMILAQFVDQPAEAIVRKLERFTIDSAYDLRVDYLENGDVIPSLVDAARETSTEPDVSLDDLAAAPIEVRERVAVLWKRWSVQRGSTAASFRRNVRRAYHSTCVVCGSHFPATRVNREPGVDAAHILPWRRFDLDVVHNGLCLCKLHHWAFDADLICVEHDSGQYAVSLSPDVERRLVGQDRNFSVDVLKQNLGPVSPDRLPRRRDERPHPELLERRKALLRTT